MCYKFRHASFMPLSIITVLSFFTFQNLADLHNIKINAKETFEEPYWDSYYYNNNGQNGPIGKEAGIERISEVVERTYMRTRSKSHPPTHQPTIQPTIQPANQSLSLTQKEIRSEEKKIAMGTPLVSASLWPYLSVYLFICISKLEF